MRRNKLTPEFEDKIVAMLTNGETKATVVEDLDISLAIVRKVIKTRSLSVKLPKDLVGLRFGRLTVNKHAGKNKYNSSIWECSCSCGTAKLVDRNCLAAGGIRSCGCITTRRFYCGLPVRYFYQIEKGAISRGLSFSITPKFLWDLFLEQGGRCWFTNRELRFELCKRKLALQTASLDRLDPSKGYSEDNVKWVHKQVNRCKMDKTEAEFRDWCEKIAKNNP